MLPYTDREIEALATAIKDNPILGYRTLAEKLYTGFPDYEPSWYLQTRSQKAIYSALRRFKANRQRLVSKAVKSAKYRVVNAGIGQKLIEI